MNAMDATAWLMELRTGLKGTRGAPRLVVPL
jgi:hypothetical protein